MEIRALTDETYLADLLAEETSLVVASGAWCAHGEALLKDLKRLPSLFAHMQILLLDPDQSPECSGYFGLKASPTMFLIKNGRQIDHRIGRPSKDALHDWIARYA